MLPECESVNCGKFIDGHWLECAICHEMYRVLGQKQQEYIEQLKKDNKERNLILLSPLEALKQLDGDNLCLYGNVCFKNCVHILQHKKQLRNKK
ncbi:MAG: hypothetical protein PHF37_03190 [Phycisphaerae bacterium]|nr:hypothetical protein [Phycisphaerae bacterium]